MNRNQNIMAIAPSRIRLGRDVDNRFSLFDYNHLVTGKMLPHSLTLSAPTL